MRPRSALCGVALMLVIAGMFAAMLLCAKWLLPMAARAMAGILHGLSSPSI